MTSISEMVVRGGEQLMGRMSGPLHLRLFLMPTIVTLLAIRSGLRDARDAQPAFGWALFTHPEDRRRLFGSACKDIGRVVVVAVVVDTAYQLLVLRAFYPVQALIVAVVCAVAPYLLIRGPVTRLTRSFYVNRNRTHPTIP